MTQASLRVTLASLLVLGLTAGPAAAADKVSLRFGFVATGLDAIWTYGIERGFFREAGLEVELREGKGSAVTAQTVAAGGDDFGVDIDGGTFLTLAAKGLPATAILSVAAKSPLVVFSPKAKPIKTPAELAGKSIAITAGDGPSALLPALLELNKVDASKVTQVNMQPGPKLTSLLSGRVEGVATNVVLRPTLESKGQEVYSLMYADFGVVTPGLYLIASNQLIQAKSDVVRRFVAAAVRSMTATEQDPEAAAASFSKVYPQYSKDMALNETRVVMSLFRSPDTEGKPLGTVSLADARTGAEILQKFGSYPAGVDPTGFVTNRFQTGE
ncbi:MAG: ABC transporter substrate-binding protein [Alphaproteobacteria bacterium]|jgi:NitT/TauT family transport system substrate-binding protein|nr:ABC transporter substrate-binding protein [Alphaproteobacteria bacterium]